MTKSTSDLLVLEGKPVPASRPRVTPRGTFYPKAHTARKEDLRKALGTQENPPPIKPVELRILSVMPRYKTSDYPVHRADVDNLAKLPMDSMTDSKKFWHDDNLVALLTSAKRFTLEGEEPHTKVRIIDIEGSVEDYVEDAFWK